LRGKPADLLIGVSVLERQRRLAVQVPGGLNAARATHQAAARRSATAMR